MKERKLNASLMKDVFSVCGGLYSLNAPNAIGYLFNPSINRKSVVNGMFCNFRTEINSNEWDYFFDFETKITYKLI